jgi:flagellar hook-associated protein 2
MEPIGTFQGLATGINFRDLVDQIIAAESAPVLALQARTAQIDRKNTAWGDFQSRVQTLKDRSAELSDGTLFNSYKTSVVGMSGTSAPLSVSAGTSATPGSFGLKVNQLATREKVAGDSMASRTEALGFEGDILVGGRAVAVSATQSLDDVAAAINQVNKGSRPSGVTAAVVAAAGGGHRLVLTAVSTGAAGITLADGGGGVLSSLGFVDGTTSIRHQTSDGAKSDGLLSSSAAVGTLLGLSSPAAGTITVGGLVVAVDLSTDSLDDIAGAINTASAGGGVSAAVVSETNAAGTTVKRLDVSGTTTFVDPDGILGTLGLLEGGRGAVTQTVQGASFTDGDAVTAASAGTLLTDLWGGGADAGVQAGDTLTISGARGDGTTFTKTFTVGGGSTYQDLVNSLNSTSDAFGSGARTATASIAGDGSLVVTDGSGGDSRLALSIVTNNQGGGTLDFGDFAVTAHGRAREIAEGLDAEIEIDGVFLTRSSNTVSDVVEGVTLTLNEASGEEVTVGIDRNVATIVSGITAFVKAYNTITEFVDSQFTGAGAVEGTDKRPLSGDGVIRSMRSQLQQALAEVMSASVTDVANLSELGITRNRLGTFDINSATLTAAIENDPLSVQRYFSVYGAGSTGSLEYLGASDATKTGSYDVSVTVPAAQATHTGAVFAGPYADDATPDTLSVTDAGTGSVYDVSLADGMTLTEIVEALNTEFSTATARQIQATEGFYADAVGTVATDATLLQDLHLAAGTPMAVADGDTLTFSGTDSGGGTFFREWSVTDVATQTLGNLRAQVADLMGADVQVTLEGGALTVTAIETGRASFALTVSSDNLGGGVFSVGSVATVTAGRGTVGMVASDSGGALALTHSDYGSGSGFDLAFTAGGTAATTPLGVTDGSYRGVDVVGTLGGEAATGSGRILTGGTGTTAEGLALVYTGTGTGAVGSLRFSRGIASLVEVVSDSLLGSDAGSVKGVIDALDTQKEGINRRIEEFESRMDRRYDFLIKKFSALEEAMARAQSQMTWMQSQLGALTQGNTQ